MRVVGLEPTTHGLKGRCSPSLNSTENKTYKSDDNNLAENLALLVQKFPDLVRIIEAWPDLSKPVKAGVLAMVQTAGDKPQKT